MVETVLLKTARSLNQGGPETTPAKIEKLWEALAATAGDSGANSHVFHTPKKIALRWILKTMSATGSAASEAETLRRWPLAWHVLAGIFQRIPLFTLAKSLADRRFVAVLQKTAKDLATRHSGALGGENENKNENENPRKRKKWQAARFDLDALRTPEQRLVSAAAVFGALRALLQRIDERQAWSGGDHDHIGAELIKSFFYTSAADAMALLEPLLSVCNLALTSGGEEDDDNGSNGSNGSKSSSALEGQSNWIATLAALWDLHLHGATDAAEVAMHLAPVGFVMLGRLLGLAASDEVVTTADVRRLWAAGLQRFFTRQVVLPACSAYLNRGDVTTLALAVGDAPAHASSAASAAVRATVLFHLALAASQVLASSGGGTAGRDGTRWLQAAFDQIQAPLRASTALTPEARNRILSDLLDMARRQGAAPSVETLQSVCRYCALPGLGVSKREARRRSKVVPEAATRVDWRLIAAVAQCDADAFLAPDKGEALLDDVLAHLSDREEEDSEYEAAAAFLVALAKGFARGRNLVGFIARWHASLGRRAIDDDDSDATLERAWLHPALRAAVAMAVQPSLTTMQLDALLVEQFPPTPDGPVSEAAARLVVLDAVSAGIYLEAYENVLGTRLLDSAAAGADRLPSTLAPGLLAMRWRLVRRTLAWADTDAVDRLWEATRAPLQQRLPQPSQLGEDAFEALVCAFAFWMALKFSGAAEQEASDVTRAFFDRFQAQLPADGRHNSTAELAGEAARLIAACDSQKSSLRGNFASETTSLATCLAWVLCDSSQFVNEIVQSSKEPSAICSWLAFWQSAVDSAQSGTAGLASLPLFSNCTTQQNKAVTNATTEQYIQALEEAKTKTTGENGPRPTTAILGLLRTPASLLQRHLRERIVACLTPQEQPTKTADAPPSVDEVVLELDLLIKAMQESHGDVDFDRLVWLGEIVQAAIRSAPLRSALSVLDRFQHVAVAALKPGIADLDRVLSRISTWKDSKKTSAGTVAVRLVLLKAVVVTSKVDTVKLAQAKEKLASLVVKQIASHLEDEDTHMAGTEDETTEEEHLSLPLLLALDAATATDIQTQLEQQGLPKLTEAMKTTADRLCGQNQKMGWKWKAFLAKHMQTDRLPRELSFSGLFDDDGGHRGQEDLGISTAAALFLDSSLLQDYLAGETRNDTPASLMAYIRDLIAALDDGPSPVAQLLAIQHLLGHLLDAPDAGTAQTADGFDLRTAHSRLNQRLPHARTVTEAKLLAQTLRALLLDDRAGAGAMGQWNIDATMSAVVLAVTGNNSSSSSSSSSVASSPVVYDGACRLVEAILRRHRLRLEGRFHLVVATLQALLRRLVASNNGGSWTPQAKRFSRLLELICEPSTAAVTTTRAASAGTAVLHSATDKAKRSAGQHMYVVIVEYVKLQADGAVVARSVREALETGLFSILSITPDKTRRLVNDIIDPGDRVLYRELYRRWVQFGKWRGV